MPRFFARLAAVPTLVALAGGSAFAQPALREPAEYRLSAVHLNLEAMDTPPQTLISARRVGNRTEAVVGVAPRTLALPDYAHGPVTVSDELGRFLRPSAKIESDARAVEEIAKELRPDDGDLAAFVRRVLSWTSGHIDYDRRLAREIWEGRSWTRSAAATLDQRRGTCSEYANVFIAVMRAGGVPARFVSGYFAGQRMYHAWAEVYLPGCGWLPVDPQMGAYGVSNQHIKLFHGVDFAAIGVPLREIRLELERVDAD